MPSNHVCIIGCGYTGRRVALRLLAAGVGVTATTRNPRSLDELAAGGARIVGFDLGEPQGLRNLTESLPSGARVLLSIPTLRGDDGPYDPTPQIATELGALPSRVVYLSTTGVYGDASEVDETTPASPLTERQRLRVQAERTIESGPWPSLVLRPAAIYGPGRGVHVALREGRFNLVGDGSNFVSRVHVDDLAEHAEKALLSDVTGAYPAADEHPCASREIAEFCAHLLGLPVPRSVTANEVSVTRRADRRVDGRAIRRILGVQLRYPSYRQGIPAALAEEKAAGQEGAADASP